MHSGFMVMVSLTHFDSMALVLMSCRGSLGYRGLSLVDWGKSIQTVYTYRRIYIQTCLYVYSVCILFPHQHDSRPYVWRGGGGVVQNVNS